MPPQMLRVGLNPYGIAYTVGLHGAGTPRANPRPLDLWGYLDLAERVGATQAIEFPVAWLAPLSPGEMDVVRERVEALGATPVLSQKSPVGGYGVAESLLLAPRIGARVVRTALTPVLCGDRAEPKYRWPETLAEVRQALAQAAPRNGRRRFVARHRGPSGLSRAANWSNFAKQPGRASGSRWTWATRSPSAKIRSPLPARSGRTCVTST
jgi:hypothetical protein